MNLYKIFLLFLAFINGSIVMGIELIGSRVLSPFFGNTIFVWGSIISVFMGGLSLGYYFGGKYSDNFPSLKKLAFIMFFSSLFIILIPLISDKVNNYIFDLELDVRYASLLSSISLFLIPTFGLGMVSPYVIKLSTTEIDKVGSSSGSIFSISTFGSILGTILTSFYLITIMKISTIFYTFGIILIVLCGLTLLINYFVFKKVEN